MAISDELSRLITAKAGIKSALEEKGLTIGDSSTLDEFPGLISEMEVGGVDGIDTSTLIDLIEGDIQGSFEIPEGTTKLKNLLFQDTQLSNITLPNTLKEIGNNCFSNAKIDKINGSRTLNFTGYDKIGNSAFNNFGVKPSRFGEVNRCNYSLIIDSSNTVLEQSSFSTIGGLMSFGTLKDYYGFTDVSINCSLKQMAFYNSFINNLTIGTDVSIIPQNCFGGVKWLSKLVLPASITKIENQGIQTSTSVNLYNVTFLSDTPPTIGSNTLIIKPNLAIYVKNSAINSYKNAGGNWNNVSTYIVPLAAIDYDASTYTVTASGRDNVELYVDASLINSSVYTFVPDTIDVSHNITVKSVDPSLGVLDEVTQEILIEGETQELKNYMALTAVQNSSVIFINADNNVDLKYSSDGVNWSNMTFGSAGKLNLPAGETIYFKGNNPNPATGLGAFNLTGKVDASGNVMSLIYDENFENQSTVPDYAFQSLFQLCEGLRSVENLLLPATTLGTNCYKNMFMSCSNITKAPELPALTLVSGCYDSIFDSCSKLNYIKAMFTTEPSDTYLRSWASGVAMEGTLVLNAAAEWDPMNYDMELGNIVLDWTIEKVNA